MRRKAAFSCGVKLLLAALALAVMMPMAPLSARAGETAGARPVVSEITGRGPAAAPSLA